MLDPLLDEELERCRLDEDHAMSENILLDSGDQNEHVDCSKELPVGPLQ